MHTTNYTNTFISVAEDCTATSGVPPTERSGKPTVAGLQYAMIENSPYEFTSDDVVFSTSTAGRGLSEKADRAVRQKAREEFFSKGQACLRASGLCKKFGWGVHCDGNGRVAIFAVDSRQYRQLATDPRIKQVNAMRSKRT